MKLLFFLAASLMAQTGTSVKVLGSDHLALQIYSSTHSNVCLTNATIPPGPMVCYDADGKLIPPVVYHNAITVGRLYDENKVRKLPLSFQSKLEAKT